MISKKYKKHREYDIFGDLPTNNNYHKSKTVLSKNLFDVRPFKVLKLVT